MAGVTEFNDQKENLIIRIRKRDGREVNFEPLKISDAIYKALVATGKPDFSLSEKLANKVVQKMIHHGYGSTEIPSVEDVQDVVESILIEEGLSDTAKAYILYRHERRKLRDEKMKILNKKVLDEVDKAFDINSLRVLAARYLLRDGNNEIVEGPKQMFERVAILVAIPDIMHDSRLFALSRDKNYNRSVEEAEKYYSKLNDFDLKLKIGNYYLNKYHFEAMIRHYIDLAKQEHMKITFKELLRLIAEGKFAAYGERIKEYYNLMVSRDFLPNTPTLMNAGGRLGQLSACFVLDMPDDMQGIMKSSTDAAMIFKSGGGVGINYSDLRPEGDIVASTSGVASGPTSFMRIIDTITDVVKQGGKRRGANMGILEVWHPDVEKFVTAKTKPGIFENFNVSVGVWDDFWRSLVTQDKNLKYTLRNPRTREPIKQIDSHALMDLISFSAWKSAEPGVIFFDNINKYNPCINAKGGPLRATNPCGEQSLYPNESCNLGSINLANFVKRKADGRYEFDWQRYEQAIRLASRFLDNIIDINKYPVDEIDANTKLTRRIGLGIMGLADLLFLLRIPYNSEDGYEFMYKLAETMSYYSMEESVAIAKARGPFPLLEETDYVKGKIPVAGYYELPKEMHTYDWNSLIEKIKKHGIRNSWTSTIAPTGTLSMIADTSNGVEPIFAVAFEKRVTVGRFFYTNRVFEAVLRENSLYDDEILSKIANNYGSGRGLPEIPGWMQKIFVTAIDIHWTDHLMAQAIWQKWIANAIAKTINMPGDVTAEDVKCAYLLSHDLGLKGVTVYRDGSRHEQVLHITGENTKERRFSVVPSRYAIDYIRENISEPYVLEALEKIFKDIQRPDSDEPLEKGVLSVERQQHSKIEPASASLQTHPLSSQYGLTENEFCPSCRAKLIMTEGCDMCIECGFSSCVSG